MTTTIALVALFNRQDGPIALYGATGYTGRLVAAELAAAKADFVLSGRNRTKLDALAGELDGDVAVQPAALDDQVALRSLLSDCAAVIDCAGPFIRHGEPVLRAAVETATHYLDTTGEQAYMRMAFERYGPEAEAAGVAVIPAMGFDYVPGDMIAVAHRRWHGRARRALARLLLAELQAQPGNRPHRPGDPQRRGRRVEQHEVGGGPGSAGAGHLRLPGPVGSQRMIRYPRGRADHRAAPHPHPQCALDHERVGFLQRPACALFAALDAARWVWR